MTMVWSCGGGTQSAAIAALIVAGELPRPDAAVIADTGREVSSTWRYYDDVLRPQLLGVGVDLIRLPHTWATVDLFSGAEGDTVLMPLYTDHQGTPGQLPKYCSNEWKTRPLERYCRSLGLTGGDMWIGFSIDEIHRMRNDPGAKWVHRYPLIDRRMSRGDCIACVLRMGWPHPPRSRCRMCPYQTDHEWRELSQEERDAAVGDERVIRARDPSVYLHRSCKPLDQVDFTDAQGDLLGDQCGSGHCFT